MALYLVVHHRRDTSQPWANSWLDDEDNRLKAITTKTQIGRFCETAMIADERVFIHRCGWGADAPSICCCASVAKVAKVDNRTSFVEFAELVPLDCEPSVSPVRGQNYYEYEPVEIKAKFGD